MPRTRHLVAVVAALVLLGVPACHVAAAPEGVPRSLAAIKASGRLVVLTRNAPTTWYIGRDGEPTGPEHDLVEAFASWLGVEAVYEQRDSIGDILEAVNRGDGDLAAAGLTITRDRRRWFLFGPPYQPVTQQVVCRRDNVQPESLAELARVRVAVIARSSYVELLQALESEGYPVPGWTAVEDTTTEDLLRRVWLRQVDCTIADSTIVDINRRYYPELLTPMNLSREQQLGWVLPPGSDELLATLRTWMERFRASGQLADVQEKYYGFFEQFDYVDTRILIRRTHELLPRYRRLFREAADAHGLPWLLLAAQAYQESHWNERARSPTGVRGMMMLTQVTAQALGVDDRLDARQSIFGGAKYLAALKGRFVDDVPEPDRTYLALAAYNVGRAHMHDAQVLARRQGLSPHRWRDIKQVLPLLSDPRHYRTLRYGYARGREPVRYVQRIREYHHILEKALEDPVVDADPVRPPARQSPQNGTARLTGPAPRGDG